MNSHAVMMASASFVSNLLLSHVCRILKSKRQHSAYGSTMGKKLMDLCYSQ